MSDTFETIKSVIADVMKIDASGVNMDTRFIEDLKADSMDQFFLIDGLMEKFGISIPDDEARQIKKVADVVHYLETHR